MTGKKGDSRLSATSAARSSKGRTAGKWILSYGSSRAERVSDFQDFKDDCESTHESMVGSEVGPVLKTCSYASVSVSNAPDPVVRADFITVALQPSEEGKEDGSGAGSDAAAPTEHFDERAYMAALRDYKVAESLFIQESKSAQMFKLDCERKHLPALFVWLLSRLDRGLRTRVEGDSRYAGLYAAHPRNPCDLMDLIEIVMTKGDIRDEAFESFEVIQDLFGSSLKMRDDQSIVDFEKLIKDKQRFIQSKPLWNVDYVTPGSTTIKSKCVFNEEFFVNLMFTNLSKQYETAMIDYSNQISAGAIKRRTTFEGLTDYFSQVRSNTTGDMVSATTLTTLKSSSGDPKKQYKEDGSNNPARVRPCSHCGGAHWDSKCPTLAKKKTKSKSKPAKPGAGSAKKKAAAQDDSPTATEIAKALVHVRSTEAKKASTLAAFSGKAFADVTEDEYQNLLSAYADNSN